RIRLRRGIPFSRNVAFWRRPLLYWPNGLPGHAVKSVEDSLFGRLRHGFDHAPVDSNVDEHRRAWNIEIPDAVMHQLVVPLALARFQIHRDDGFAKQAIAGPMASIFVAGRQLHREIGDS